jgi:hypothetical protein
MYDRILDALGERVLTKTESVVREDRPNGETWLIKRPWFEDRPDRRYSVTQSKVAKLPEKSPEKLIEEIDGDIIAQSAIVDHITGDERLFLEYLRSSEDFSCVPMTYDEEMAVKLVPQRATSSSGSTGEDASNPDSTKGGNSNADSVDNQRRTREETMTQELKYLAAVVDTIGSLTCRISKNNRYEVRYSIRPVIMVTRPESRQSVLEALTAYCDRNDITCRFEEQEAKNTVRVMITGIANTRALLDQFEPHMYQQAEAVEIMRSELLPALDAGKHHTKEGFLNVMEIIDRLRETHLRNSKTTYDKAYFEAEWADDLDHD